MLFTVLFIGLSFFLLLMQCHTLLFIIDMGLVFLICTIISNVIMSV